MQESLLFRTYVHKAGVESRHQFLDASKVQVSYGKGNLLGVFLVFHQIVVLGNGYLYAVGLDVDCQFACHRV